jgi:hypothetical protein
MLGFVFVAWIAVPVLAFAQITLDRFKSEAPVALQKFYRQIPDQFECRLTCQDRTIDTDGATSRILRTVEVVSYRKGKLRLSEYYSVKGNQKTPFKAYGVNDRYSFTLRWGGGKWILEQLKFEVEPVFFPELMFAERGFAIVPYQTPLEALYVPDNDITVAKAEELSGNENGLVRVTFDPNVNQNSAANIDGVRFTLDGITHMSIDYDPSQYWLPRTSQLQLSESGISVHDHKVMWEYGKTDGVTHCKRIRTIETWTETNGPGGSGMSVWDDIKYDFSKVPRERFFLSHYGLPEPPGRFGGSWLWVCIILSVALVVLAVWRLIKGRWIGQAA